MDVRQFFNAKTETKTAPEAETETKPKTEPTLNLGSSINKRKPKGDFLYKDHPLLEEMRSQHEAKWADCVKRMAHGTPWAKKTPEER